MTVLLAGIGLLLALTTLLLLAQTSQSSEQFDRLSGITLLVNAVGIVVLFILLVGNLARLVQDLRRHVPGAKLKGRMVAMFIGLAVLPLLLVYYFSAQFLNRGIDSWFTEDVEQGLEDALELSRAALGIQMRTNLNLTLRFADAAETMSEPALVSELVRMRRETGAVEVTVFASNSRIVATSLDRSRVSVPTTPTDEMLLQVAQGRPYVSLDPLEGGGYQVRTAAPMQADVRSGGRYVVQALYPVTQRLAAMADSVGDSYTNYKRQLYLREPLKRTLTLTLTVVLLVSLLASIYGAFFFSRRLVAPIQQLVAGTRAVAAGDFDTQLPQPSRDEIGFLVSSFNDMTRRLAAAREEARDSQAQVEAERANLEVILARLSTGVVSLEPDLRIRTANQAAGAILGVDLESRIGELLPEVAKGHPLLEQFVDVARVHVLAGENEWREQIILRGDVGRRVLTCACTNLPAEDGHTSGFVVVFDDITALLQAQRDAAWGEVARRLAHEIKNPLTPIQLSAERLRQKYLRGMAPNEAQVLDRATHTIVQQVEAMKEMVNAFSEYARTPDMDMTRFDLNRLVREVIELYRAQDTTVDLTLDLDNELPPVDADAGRVRQILHNLVRNAVEALEGQEDGAIDIITRAEQHSGATLATITVEDNGPGFQAGPVEQIFDPYVTSKPKGTGLGLAIVKKLVEEHAGSIYAENRRGGGARIRISLPVDEASREIIVSALPRRGEQRRERA
ncbi:MAG: ATP-binding protein [Gammaproteobacteria bacterium]